MRLASYRHNGIDQVGHVADDQIWPIAATNHLGPASLLAALDATPHTGGDPVAVRDVHLRPVIAEPRRIICIGLNYQSHVTETKRELSDYPVLFTKFASSLVGAYDDIAVPPESTQVDYEAELAVIIGRPGRRITANEAAEHIAGYSVANDVTMRDFQYKTHQWLQGKSWDASTPLGPYLVTPDEFGPDPVFEVALTLNGERLQGSDTSKLIYDIPTLISTISVFTTLSPGDVILTGTPGGVGFRRDPQVFLRAGDQVIVDIPGVGRTINHVTSEAADSVVSPG